MDQIILPQGLTYQKLYQINDQSIWFLAWVLKQRRCNPDFNQQILSDPFFIKRDYRANGQLDYLSIHKNGNLHGLSRGWRPNGQLSWEREWQNGLQDGIVREWHPNGQLMWKEHWQNDQLHGLDRGWYSDGQLVWEKEWQNGQLQ